MFDQALLIKVLINIVAFFIAGVTLYPWFSKKITHKDVSTKQGALWGIMTGMLYSIISYFIGS